MVTSGVHHFENEVRKVVHFFFSSKLGINR